MIPCFASLVSRLERDQKIVERKTRVYDYDRREFMSLRNPSLESFSAEVIDIMAATMRIILSDTAYAASMLSHDAYWEGHANEEQLSVGAASIGGRAPEKEQMEWASEQFDAFLLRGA